MNFQSVNSFFKEKFEPVYGAFCAIFMLNLTDLSWSNLKAVAQQGYSAPLMASALTTDPKNTFTLTPFVTVLGGIALSVALISLASLSPLTLALSLSAIIGSFCAGLQVLYVTREELSKELSDKVVAASKNEKYGKTLLSILREYSNIDKKDILDQISDVKADSLIADEILARLIESYSRKPQSLAFVRLSFYLKALKSVISDDAQFVEEVTNIVNHESFVTKDFDEVVECVQESYRKVLHENINATAAKQKRAAEENAEKPAGIVNAVIYCLNPAKVLTFARNLQEGGLRKALRSSQI